MGQLTETQVSRILAEIEHKTEAEAMTDGELAAALIKDVWGKGFYLWTREGVLIDEAITRLKRADTLRRWNERKERRANLRVET